MITTKVSLQLVDQTVPAIIPVVQGDTGRSIIFEPSDFTIPEGATATYYIQKPSGEAVYNSAEITGNTVVCNLTAQSIIETGENNIQVRVVLGEDIVTSFDAILMVRPFRGIDAVESETEINIFDKAVEQAEQEISDRADEIIAEKVPEIEALVEEVIESIPEDYTQLSNDVDDLKADLNVKKTVTANYSIISDTGVKQSGDSYSYVEIKVVPGIKIYGYTRASTNKYYGCAFYTEDGTYISGSYNTGSSNDWNYEVTAPTDAYIFRISCNSSYISNFTYKFSDWADGVVNELQDQKQSIKSNASDIDTLEASLNGKADAAYDYSTAVTLTLENGVINKKGTSTYTGDANYRHARVDSLTGGEHYSITGICVNNSDFAFPLLSILDSSNNVISTPYTGANGQITDFRFVTPTGADHMFVNFKIDNPYGLWKGSAMSIEEAVAAGTEIATNLSDFYDDQRRRALYNLSFNAPFTWGTFDKGYISWMNDDARADMYLYKNLCDDYNIPYANAVPWEKIAQNPNIDGTPLVTYLKSIITDGGEVFSHSLTWLTSSSSKEDFYTQFITSKRVIEAAIENDIYGIIQAGGSGYSGADYNKCQEYSISYYQFSDAYGVTPQYTLTRTRFLRGDYNSDSEQIAAYKDAIDDAVQNHKWLRLWCHGTDEVSIDVLTAVFEYAQDYFDAGTLVPTTWKNMYDTFRSHS